MATKFIKLTQRRMAWDKNHKEFYKSERPIYVNADNISFIRRITPDDPARIYWWMVYECDNYVSFLSGSCISFGGGNGMGSGDLNKTSELIVKESPEEIFKLISDPR